MAYETIKSLLANQAMQKMYAESPMGRQELRSKELANKLTEMEMDKMFPMELEKMANEIDFMLAEPAIQRRQLQQEKTIAEQRRALDLEIAGMRTEATRFGVEQRRAGAMEVAEEVSRRKELPSTVIHKTDTRPGAIKLVDLYEDAEGNPSNTPNTFAVNNYGDKTFIGRSGVKQRELSPESSTSIEGKRKVLEKDPGWEKMEKVLLQGPVYKKSWGHAGGISNTVLFENIIAGDETVWKAIYEVGGSLLNSAQIYMDSRGLRVPSYTPQGESLEPSQLQEQIGGQKVYNTPKEVALDKSLTREEQREILINKFGME